MTRRIRHALTWSFLGEVASRTLAPLVFLILVRFLAPSDFGVLTAALAIVSFSQLFCDAGLASALIQRQDRPEDSANAVFWMNSVFAAIVAVVLSASASHIGAFFGDDRVIAVVQVLSIQVLLAATGSVHTALLQKQLDFKRLFWIRVIAAGAPATASIPLAIHGAGYWALVGGVLCGQLIQTLALWKLGNWRPHWGIDTRLARQLLSFGKWAMLSGILGWCYGWLDTIVVGRYLGAHEMGLYRVGNTFVGMIFGLAFSSLLPVLYSYFSQTQGDLPKLRSSLDLALRAIATVSLPVGALIFWFRLPVEQLVFGDAWAGIGSFIGILALTQGTAWLVGANGEVFRAVGKPHLESLIMGVPLIAYLVTYLLAIQQGITVFLYARFGLVLLALIPHIWLLRHAIGFSFTNFMLTLRVPLASLLLASIFTRLTDALFGGGTAAVFASGLAGMLSYLALVFMLDRPLLDRLAGGAQQIDERKTFTRL